MNDEFRFGKLGLQSRLALSAGLFALGIALQLAIPEVSPLGFGLVIAGWFPLMLKTATNKPADQGLEEWRPVTMTEIDRLDDGIRQSKALKKKTRSLTTGVLVGITAPFLGFALLGFAIAGRGDLTFIILNTVALLVPSLFFGRVSVFVPKDIAFKMPSFRALLSEPLPAGIAVSPYLRFDKDKAGLDVPEDLRLMFELKRPPEDLVGVQVQAAVNKGPNGEVPYLYAVVLTRGTSGPAFAAASRLRRSRFEVEAGSDGEFGTVVIRQSTESGGYHTTPDDCRELQNVCVKFLEALRA
jgi:hypothetical protein